MAWEISMFFVYKVLPEFVALFETGVTLLPANGFLLVQDFDETKHFAFLCILQALYS